jgi:cellulose synthase/poly-beta-1,6-N-acetylglucosamine synthase-like glycosyltransferase
VSTDDAALRRSREELRRRFPEMSAHRLLTPAQLLFLAALVVGLGVAVGRWTIPTLIGINATATAVYILFVGYRTMLFRESLGESAQVRVTDEEARALTDAQLPLYTVLVPAYREARVIAQVIAAVDALEYPRHLLEVMLLLEEDDHPTIDAVRAAACGPHIRVVLVPAAQPRTKPKACNYGLQQARGELVTVFDAEDRPEPLQLRRAVAALRRLGPRVACLQAHLSYHNAEHNLLTRWFTCEYDTWFPQMLPVLARRGVPVPLGGTSFHIRREVLDEVGAWDPHNVTEDADLGVRLHRLGHRTAVLDSRTLEEANCDYVNWVKQRSRWYKGYLRTWLVHMRNPLRLRREVGNEGFLSANMVLGGTPLLAALNPLLWLLTVLWLSGQAQLVRDLFPAWLFYPSLLALFGNFLVIYAHVVGTRMSGRPHLAPAAMLLPLYWALMSIAAIKALLQLAVAPSFWEKTVHGLSEEG